MRFSWCLPVFFAFMTLCASSRSSAPAGGFLHKEVYPTIIDCSDSISVNGSVNVYTSTAFRMRHSRFLNEFEDSLRSMKRGLPDSGGEKRAILTFCIDKTGKVHDVSVECADSSDTVFKEALKARTLSWQFVFPPSFSIKVIQDIRSTGRTPSGFFGKHRIAVIIGLIAVGVLLLY
jgi:hypothetical protein